MKRSSQATSDGQSPTREAPAGGLAQPDERDQTTETGPVDRKTLGPRRVIQQAARDVARGLEDTDQHGTPNNVPGPVSRQAAKPVVAQGGDRSSYADDQQDSRPKKAPKPPPNGGIPPRTR